MIFGWFFNLFTGYEYNVDNDPPPAPIPPTATATPIPSIENSFYFNSGFSYTNLGEHNKAREDYSKAIYLNPNDVKAYFNRGFSYTKVGMHSKAVEDYSKVIELNSNHVIDHSHKYNHIIELDYILANAYFNRSLSYSQLRKHEKSKADMAKAFEIEDATETQGTNAKKISLQANPLFP